MNYILYDDINTWSNLLPITYTRPVSEIRTGILTIKEKWEKQLNSKCSYKTIDYLQFKFSCDLNQQNIFINSAVIPDKNIITAINNLNKEQVLKSNNQIIAFYHEGNTEPDLNKIESYNKTEYKSPYTTINYPWDIFIHTGKEIANDINILFKNKHKRTLNKTNNIISPENIYIEEGVKAEYITVNASSGPVFLGRDSEIMEGSVIRGPFALCNHSILKMSAKVYGPVTIGPHSKVGGEISESVILGFSNKAHDGFLGNSVIGEWCNLGADTNNSNLKNNYTEVKLWNYQEERFKNSGLQFCGLIMGDHSKCGINTMFNTGTVVGVSANIFGSGFPRNFIPSFSWGGAQGFMVYKLEKAFEVMQKVMKRRNIELTITDREILQTIYNNTEKYRRF